MYDRTPAADVRNYAGAVIAPTNKTPMKAGWRIGGAEVHRVLATGYNIVDVEAARRQGITVTNIPTYGTASVAQFVFALLLELCHNVGLHSASVRAGEWSRHADWSFWKSPLTELAGKTMGVIGFGRIGRSVGRIADAMGMKVIANDTYQPDPPPYQGFRWVSVEELLRESDVVSRTAALSGDVGRSTRARWR